MKRKVMVFFPHNPCPPTSGAHRRMLEMLAGLRELGCDVVFSSSTWTSECEWTAASRELLRKESVSEVRIYEPTAWDERTRRALKKFNRFCNRTPPINSRLRTPPGMRRWFAGVVKEVEPDVLFMNYAFFDGLINHSKWKSVRRIIDSLDLVVLNQQMQELLRGFLRDMRVLDVNSVPGEMLDERLFEKLHCTLLAEEFRIYDKYDHTIAISPKDADVIRKNTHSTGVPLIPMSFGLRQVQNRYNGNAIFAVGPNFFNIQGYLYFAKKVLPLVRKRAPDFVVDVTGTFLQKRPIAPVDGICLTGHVSDLSAAYASARFAVCPVLGGTGQPIKIVEAMAHGLPVISLRAMVDVSAISHAENGFVANDAEEFAEYVVRLWNDPDLCRKLGDAARQTIATRFSRQQLCERLSELLNC